MIKEFKDIKCNIDIEADVCVIGTGAGGAVVAKELSEKGLRVVALEEGSPFTKRNYSQDPCDMMGMMYRDCATNMTIGLPPASVTMGKTLGGTTTVNSATCFRTPRSIVEEWKTSFDCAGIDYDSLIPYFEKVEKEVSVTELTEDILGNVYQIIKRGARAIGVEAKPLKHNIKECKGAGTCQLGCIRDAKQSMDISYLPKAVKAGADIYTNCRATRVNVENWRATGVEGVIIDPSTNRRRYKVKVKADVVCLAMGSLITPAFMLKNRLANTSGQVGRNLTIHPCGRIVAEMEEEVNGHLGVSQGGYIDAFKDEGIMLEGASVPPGILLMAMPGIGEEHKYFAKHYKNLAAFGAMICDSSRGFVKKGGLGYSFHAFYSLNQADAEKMHRGIAITAELFFAAGAKRVFPGCFLMPVLNNREDLHRFRNLKVRPWHFEVTAFHPLGTCRMGSDPRTSVIDLNLETHDIKGLFIPDGSPFPTSLGVNPQVTIMAFANRCADYIAANYGKYKGV